MNSQRIPKSVIGVKQVTKAVKNDLAKFVYLADDADDRVLSPLMELCKTKNIKIITGQTKKELGKSFKIDVPAAAVAELLEDWPLTQLKISREIS